MAPGSCITCQSPHINTLANLTEKLDKLAGAQGPIKRSNVESNKAIIPFEASTLPFVLLLAKDLFTKFMKVFIEMTQTQARDQEQLEP